jgi:hypothetical protein
LAQVQRELEDCISRLAKLKEPKDRRALLAGMRFLLKEAE